MQGLLLQSSPSGFFEGVAIPLAALMAFTVVGWIVILAVRRSLRGNEEEKAPFSLEELRRLHRDGELSDEEFARAKSLMLEGARRNLGEAREAVEQIKGAAAREASPPSAPPPPRPTAPVNPNRPVASGDSSGSKRPGTPAPIRPKELDP